jgi:hypothetical protein
VGKFLVIKNNNNNKYYYYYYYYYYNTRNMEHEMYDYTGNNWSHWNIKKTFKEKSGSHTRKTLNRFTTKDSCTCNITHNTESTAV